MKKTKSQIIYVDEGSEEVDELEPVKPISSYESPSKMYEIIQSREIDSKVLKQMKESMLANDYWLLDFELYGGINALLKLL